MTPLSSLLILVLSVGTVVSAQTPNVYVGKQENLPVEVAPQPIAFSHKKHTAAGVACLDCHSGATKKERAGIPNAQQCMLCHMSIAAEHNDVKRLAAIHERGEELAWVRVYQVPDFVFFSHASHVKTGEACEACHGPVGRREVLAKEVSTSMTQCMNCHAAKQMSTDCHLCHDLGQ